ncbi:DNA-binding transcriptional MerR regulator [Gracilibacillus halotolerans]|uniref:DNA-binding transcriptional MerR regulator n=1 Tax=Gracilibacillus halotolerans TaxID=74386 RepID=A0A841RLP2_9BACI|nr:MerR family transcriptional regulator [Gracilibacillus halotolerans]MBB6513691.1 DNA-binding transcriptional MerR regulator [Gracilibacillus halotolerans]
MEYTIKKLAQLSGVSTRTLRYYDEIGLLIPARINSSGYRIYGQKEVDTLQQILFYRELEFSLDSIKNLMNDPTYDEWEALISHHHHLIKKRDRLDSIIATVEQTILTKKRGIPMDDNKKFEGLKEKLIDENEKRYGKEIREKYGEDNIHASNAKLRGMSKEDYEAMTVLSEEILDLLEKAYATGNPESDLAQLVAEKHKEWLMYSWSSYSKEQHAGLAEMYVADERFTAYYDQRVKGATRFLRDAIHRYLGKSN